MEVHHHPNVERKNLKGNASDSVLAIVPAPRKTWNAKNFYIYMAPIVTSLPFKSTDGTYSQMKTSGTLRYFNLSLVNVINSYDVQLKKTEYRDEVEDKGVWILGNLIFDIMNLEVITDIRLHKPVTHNMFIRMDEKLIIDKFINLIALNKGFHFRAFQEYQEQLKIADKLIEALKKEYPLD